jgi:hypothetical protein
MSTSAGTINDAAVAHRSDAEHGCPGSAADGNCGEGQSFATVISQVLRRIGRRTIEAAAYNPST